MTFYVHLKLIEHHVKIYMIRDEIFTNSTDFFSSRVTFLIHAITK